MKSKFFSSGSRWAAVEMKTSHLSADYFMTGTSNTEALNSGVPMQTGPVFGFLCRLNASGDTLWKWNNTTTATGSGSGFFPTSLAVDNDDNIYVTAFYSVINLTLTISLDGIPLNTSALGYGSVLIKFNSSGKIIWTRQHAGTVYYNDMDLDGNGNIYIMANTQSAATYGSTTITTSSSSFWRDLIVSYDSSGAVLWAKGYGEINLNNSTASDKGSLLKIAVDKGTTPVIYAAGYFLASYNADGNIFTSNGAEDALMLKLDATGNFINAIHEGSTNPDIIYDVALNSNHEVALAYSFKTSTLINSSPYTTTTGFFQTLLLKLDSTFNYQWIRTGLLSSFFPVVAINDSGTCAITDGSTFHSPSSTFDFLKVYDPSGTLLFTKSVSGTSVNNGELFFPNAMILSDNINPELLITGGYHPTMSIDAITISTQVAFNHEIPLIKIIPASITGTTDLSLKTLKYFPNPCIDFLIVENNNSSLEIINISGQNISRNIPVVHEGSRTIFNISECNSGIYFLNNKSQNSSAPFVVVH